jgi:hypothetical protein
LLRSTDLGGEIDYLGARRYTSLLLQSRTINTAGLRRIQVRSFEGLRVVDVGAGRSFSRAWAGSTVNKGGKDAGRVEGFVPAGPRLALEANARLELRIKTSGRDSLLGVSWAPGVFCSFSFFWFEGF